MLRRPLDAGSGWEGRHPSVTIERVAEIRAREASSSLGVTSGTSAAQKQIDVYFSADVETDGPIPGPFSMLSFAMVYAGRFDGTKFDRPVAFDLSFYRELRPISKDFQPEALRVNGLDRERICREGADPQRAMSEACRWVRELATGGRAVLVAYPLSFDWSWLYWYFMHFSLDGSPFNHSGCFDVKTAYAIKAGIPIASAGRANLERQLGVRRQHAHRALEDAIAQAELFGKLFEWHRPADGSSEEPPR